MLPRVADIDALTQMKETGRANVLPDRFEDIPMPKNSPSGLFIGILAFLLGFAMVWHIWWLAMASALGLLLCVIIRSADDDTEIVIPASEVKRIEEARHRQEGSGLRPLPAGGTTS